MPDSKTNRPDEVPRTVGDIARLAYSHSLSNGANADVLLRKAGLSHKQIDDPDALLEVRSQIKFLNLVAEALDDERLGFHLAQKFDLRTVGLLHYVLASSDTLHEAIKRATRYSSIVNEGIKLAFLERKEFGISIEYVGVSRHLDRHQIEFWMAALMIECRQLTNRSLTAEKISFIHRGDRTSELQSFYGCELQFGADADKMIFHRTSRNTAIASADPYLNKLLIKYCEEALERRESRSGSFATSVENAIAVLLPHSQAEVDEVARRLGVSRRTMARRLASEGLTFDRVLRALRSDLAKRHLADRDLSISKVAWLLGYQDASTFSHAHKRWTGMTPRAIRQQLVRQIRPQSKPVTPRLRSERSA
jgi:AraC-like DNA-binding protein